MLSACLVLLVGQAKKELAYALSASLALSAEEVLAIAAYVHQEPAAERKLRAVAIAQLDVGVGLDQEVARHAHLEPL